jgi:cold shock CspA family protein
VRVLVDEQLPRHLAWQLIGQDACTVHEQGWAGLPNRELLARADGAGFDALLTADPHVEAEHEVIAPGLRIVVVHDLSTALGDLLLLVPELLAALEGAGPGEVVRVPRREPGMVTVFSKSEGRGQIRCERTGDLLFVAISQVRAETLAAGERVEFTRVEMPEGPYASDVVKVD